MATESSSQVGIVGGHLVARRLKAHGVTKLFTLSGGHLFSIYDGCREEGIEIVDVRHEQTAAFAAEGWAKVDPRARASRPLTAGPGVTNGMSAIASRAGQPLAAARARRARAGDALGPGLAAGDRPRPVRRAAASSSPRRPTRPAEIPALIDAALGARRWRRTAARPSSTSRSTSSSWPRRPCRAEPARLARAAAGAGGRRRARSSAPPRCCATRRAAGDHGRHRPLLGPRRGGAAGAGRGAADPGLPQRPRARLRAGRPRARSSARARGSGLQGADVALRRSACRWTSGSASAAASARRRRSSRRRVAPAQRRTRARSQRELYGDVRGDAGRAARRRAGGGRATPRARGSTQLRDGRGREARRRARASSTDERAPLHPVRVYSELGEVLDRDAIVIGDGGDFVSYAGRFIDTYEPGCWMDPGPFGCLGRGPGYAIGGEARPSRPPGRACCSATAPSASPGWSSTRWRATAWRSSA